MMKKRIMCAAFAFCFCFICLTMPASASETAQTAAPVYPGEPNALSCILMDAKTGAVLYEHNADAALPPASVTKVMTMLLIFEAIDGGLLNLTDIIRVSETAAEMGGSQIFLAPGEEMCVDDLLKGLIVSSANDAAVALAEAVCGSEEAFVVRMNERAAELGLKNTHFENTNGLDDTTENHVTSARDIAIMSKELMRHEKVFDYTTIWMDTIRGGTFGLSNTNRLVRFYKGATGLKTGSTSKAKFCISATAERDGLSLIAVVMGSPTRDARNALAASLLDFGFANYGCYRSPAQSMPEIRITGGVGNTLASLKEDFSVTLEKGKMTDVEMRVDLPEKLQAPVAKGEKIGTVTYISGGKEIGTADILAEHGVEKITFFSLFPKLFAWFLMGESVAE
ncbi:MAG: D-alanyl-D-alanine carboxypeptidase [Clostridia bacterium]|nr:D-alanyl-D-alanine carboxypeptidase [Clostridia bacterium]